MEVTIQSTCNFRPIILESFPKIGGGKGDKSKESYSIA